MYVCVMWVCMCVYGMYCDVVLCGVCVCVLCVYCMECVKCVYGVYVCGCCLGMFVEVREQTWLLVLAFLPCLMQAGSL